MVQDRPKRRSSAMRMISSEEEYTTDESSEDHDQAAPFAEPTLVRSKPTAKPRRWQPHEDELLTAAVNLCGEANWKSIAERVGSRNHVQCLQRWKKVLRPGLVKGQWDEKEDAALMKLATKPFKNWGTLSNSMPGRTSKQCRERWCHHLNPAIKKCSYTREEDAKLVAVHARLGNKWSQIAKELPGRTENSIKIRCKALIRKMAISSSRGCKSGAPRPAKRSAATSTTSSSSSSSSLPSSSSASASAPRPCSSSSAATATGSCSRASGSDQPAASGKKRYPVAAALPPMAGLTPQQRVVPSRGLKFDSPVVTPEATFDEEYRGLLMPPGTKVAAASGQGGAVPAPGTDRYSSLGARADPRSVEWLPPTGLRVEPGISLDRQPLQQQHQQQRYEYLPYFGQQFVDYTADSRSAGGALYGGGGGGGDEGDDGAGAFSKRPAPAVQYPGQEQQPQQQPQQLVRPHFAMNLNLPLPAAPAGAGQKQELVQGGPYPDSPEAAVDDDDIDDDGVMAQALAAVAEPRDSHNVLAPLVEDEFHVERSSAAGGDQDGGGDGGDGDDGDRNEADGGAQGNGPVKSCCSFLALNAEENMVGDMAWPAGGKEDDEDDSGAFMID